MLPNSTKKMAMELLEGGQTQKAVAEQLGVSVGAVTAWRKLARRARRAGVTPFEELPERPPTYQGQLDYLNSPEGAEDRAWLVRLYTKDRFIVRQIVPVSGFLPKAIAQILAEEGVIDDMDMRIWLLGNLL